MLADATAAAVAVRDALRYTLLLADSTVCSMINPEATLSHILTPREQGKERRKYPRYTVNMKNVFNYSGEERP